MTIPTDRVDEELLRRPAHWDIGLIRRFMIVFGPISSVFDFLTFGVMLFVPLAGWFHLQPLPPRYFLVLGAMVVIYLGLVETAKFFFYRWTTPAKPLSVPLDAQSRRAHRIATRWWRSAEAR